MRTMPDWVRGALLGVGALLYTWGALALMLAIGGAA